MFCYSKGTKMQNCIIPTVAQKNIKNPLIIHLPNENKIPNEFHSSLKKRKVKKIKDRAFFGSAFCNNVKANHNAGLFDFEPFFSEYGFDKNNTTYGLTNADYEKIKLKHLMQQAFLQSSFIRNDKMGFVKSLYDLSYSANHSVKYYAELQNICKYYTYSNKMKGYIPLFFTITLDGCYRDFLNGNFKGFNARRNDLEIPKPLRYKYMRKEPYSIKELVSVLNYQHKKLRDRYINRYRKQKHEMTKDFFKVFEPHKNGVPHLHAVWFVPNDKSIIDYIKKCFFECCPAPRHKSTDNINHKQRKNGETNCFQISIKNSTAYIMKYLQKTFRDVKKDEPLSLIHAWYIQNKVRRFTRSHIITKNNDRFPLFVWRKMGAVLQTYFKEKTFIEVNDGYECGEKPIELYEFLQWFGDYGNDGRISYNTNKDKGEMFIKIVVGVYTFYYSDDGVCVYSKTSGLVFQSIKKEKYKVCFNAYDTKYYKGVA